MNWRRQQAYTAKIIIICKTDYSVNYFNKTLHRRCLTESSDFEYAITLNIRGLRICQGSEYASGSEYVGVLDIPRS